MIGNQERYEAQTKSRPKEREKKSWQMAEDCRTVTARKKDSYWRGTKRNGGWGREKGKGEEEEEEEEGPYGRPRMGGPSRPSHGMDWMDESAPLPLFLALVLPVLPRTPLLNSPRACRLFAARLLISSQQPQVHTTAEACTDADPPWMQP